MLKTGGKIRQSLRTKKITPHVLRHTTALHLLQAGVDIAVIALCLGHESIETTHVYSDWDEANAGKRSFREKRLPPRTQRAWIIGREHPYRRSHWAQSMEGAFFRPFPRATPHRMGGVCPWSMPSLRAIT